MSTDIIWKPPSMQDAHFTPALGFPALTPLYDHAIRLLTREKTWREKLLTQLAPASKETILDVGCGTGTLAILIKQRTPGARVIGLDPDPAVLATAAKKAASARVEIEWRKGFASDASHFSGELDKAVSTLVFHQVPLDEKNQGLEAMFEAVRPGGEVHIADYCRQDDWYMRQLFRFVQALDGKVHTQANADGAIDRFLGEIMGSRVTPREVIRTPTGAISLFRLEKTPKHAK